MKSLFFILSMFPSKFPYHKNPPFNLSIFLPVLKYVLFYILPFYRLYLFCLSSNGSHPLFSVFFTSFVSHPFILIYNCSLSLSPLLRVSFYISSHCNSKSEFLFYILSISHHCLPPFHLDLYVLVIPAPCHVIP